MSGIQQQLSTLFKTLNTLLSSAKEVGEKSEKLIFQKIDSVKEILEVRIKGAETTATDAKTIAETANTTADKATDYRRLYYFIIVVFGILETIRIYFQYFAP